MLLSHTLTTQGNDSHSYKPFKFQTELWFSHTPSQDYGNGRHIALYSIVWKEVEQKKNPLN